MDLLDRLLGHDRWTTEQLLGRCRELRPAQWTQPFDLGHQTLAETFAHMRGNVRVWTDLMAQRSVRQAEDEPTATVDDMLRAWSSAYDEFAAVARRVRAEARWDATYVDVLDTPPQTKTFGGTIAHIITHNMQHRAEIIHMLSRLGLSDVLEGDVLSWERQTQRG